MGTRVNLEQPANPQLKLFPGMTAYVTVPVAVAANVVRHPTVDARTLGAGQAQAKLKLPRGIGRQLPREMDRQIDGRQERRQVAESEPRLGVGPARREQQRVAGVG